MAANLTDRTLRGMKPKADGSQREVFDADARAAGLHAARPWAERRSASHIHHR